VLLHRILRLHRGRSKQKLLQEQNTMAIQTAVTLADVGND